jgi:putative redox protein
MKINLTRINDNILFKAVNESGQELLIDGATADSGNKQALSPMQMVLAAHAGCSSIDVVSILKKQHQEITSFEVEIDGNRETGKDANVFTSIHLTFKVKGNNLDPQKVERAVQLSVEKYCSVGKILEPTAKITYSIE